eukprot:scaffold252020_cov28-Tisochrysis_lutea.AAC.7
MHHPTSPLARAARQTAPCQQARARKRRSHRHDTSSEARMWAGVRQPPGPAAPTSPGGSAREHASSATPSRITSGSKSASRASVSRARASNSHVCASATAQRWSGAPVAEGVRARACAASDSNSCAACGGATCSSSAACSRSTASSTAHQSTRPPASASSPHARSVAASAVWSTRDMLAGTASHSSLCARSEAEKARSRSQAVCTASSCAEPESSPGGSICSAAAALVPASRDGSYAGPTNVARMAGSSANGGSSSISANTPSPLQQSTPTSHTLHSPSELASRSPTMLEPDPP